jgi:hypothetical protein
MLVDAHTIDPVGDYPTSLSQTSNEPFHSSKLIHRAADRNGLGSICCAFIGGFALFHLGQGNIGFEPLLP